MPIVNWKATERCITTPIPSSHQSLANVKFRLDPNESPTVDDVRHIEGPQDWDRFTPELFVDIDVARLLSDTRLAPDNIAISVIVRDRDLGRFERVQEWGLDSLPEDAWSLNPALERFSRSVRLDVTIVATPRAPVIDGTSSPMPPGTLLAVKTFRIRAPSPGLDFPFKFVQPEKMAEQPGLHRATVCYVHWVGDDLHRAPSDLIEVWLNKDFEDKFRALSARRIDAAADHIGRSIAAQVWVDVLTKVLALESEEDSDEPGSLVFLVGDLVTRELELTLDDLRSIYRRPHGQSRLLPWSWRLARADQAFGSLKL